MPRHLLQSHEARQFGTQYIILADVPHRISFFYNGNFIDEFNFYADHGMHLVAIP